MKSQLPSLISFNVTGVGEIHRVDELNVALSLSLFLSSPRPYKTVSIDASFKENFKTSLVNMSGGR